MGKISLLVCLVCVCMNALIDRVDADSITRKQCPETVKKIETIEAFKKFADTLGGGYVDKFVNKCLHSVDGHKDIKVLRSIVEQASSVHSVCEPEFTDQLIQFDKQMKDNVTRGKLIKRKKTHRLSYFFRLFAGQVILTCKKSLVDKLLQAEVENSELASSLDKIIEMSAIKKLPLGGDTKINVGVKKLLDLATKYAPNVFDKMENLVLIESLKPTQDSHLFIDMTFQSENMIQEFMKTKKSCQLIEEYSKSSIYAVARLAWKGYMARNDLHQLDASLSSDTTVQKWIKAIQYCQGVFLVRANLDLEQDSLEKLDKEILNDNQIFTVDVNRDKPQGEPTKTNKRVHRFQQSDTFETFDDGLKCFTQSKGRAWWLMKLSGGERLLAKYITLSVVDETIERSLNENDEEPEQNVMFASGAAMSVGHTAIGHTATSSMVTHASHVTHHNTIAAIAFLIACFLTVVFMGFIIKWYNKETHKDQMRKYAFEHPDSTFD